MKKKNLAIMTAVAAIIVVILAAMFLTSGNNDSGNDDIEVTGITLDKTSMSLTKGSSGSLLATVAPSDATDKTVVWTSSNTSVATVSNGVVKAVSPGTAKITATSADGSKSASCNVTVSEPATKVTGILLDQSAITLENGSTATLKATVSPSNASNKNVTWSSSNNSVATVSNGVVKAVSAGTATITATAADGGFSSACTVTVYDKVTVSAMSDAVLKVLGNVNGDMVIDAEDVSIMKSLVASGATLTDDNKLADVNNDGAIDQKDVDFLNDMVAQKKQVIYYCNVDNEIASVHYPVTGTIIATYNKTLEAARTLGLSSQVIAIDDFSYEWPTYFPEFMDLPSIGSRFSPNVEKVLELDADAYLCGTKKWFAATLETDIGTSDMDVIRLPTWEEGQVLSGMVTLGYITQHEADAQKYIEWANGILGMVESVVGDKADSEKPTVLVLDAGKPLSTKKAGSGQYENSVRAGGYNIVKDIGSEEEYYTNLTMEWILAKDPQFIIFSKSNTAYQWNDAQLQEALDALKTDFALTSACQNGDFHMLNLEVFIGPSYPIGVLYMAKWFYPEEFKDVVVSDYLQEYIDEFCGLDMDVVEHGGFAI